MKCKKLIKSFNEESIFSRNRERNTFFLAKQYLCFPRSCKIRFNIVIGHIRYIKLHYFPPYIHTTILTQEGMQNLADKCKPSAKFCLELLYYIH